MTTGRWPGSQVRARIWVGTLGRPKSRCQASRAADDRVSPCASVTPGLPSALRGTFVMAVPRCSGSRPLSDHPIDDGVEALVGEGVPAMRTKVLQCFRRSRVSVRVRSRLSDARSVKRVLVLVGRAQEQWPRCNQPDDVVQVAQLQQAGNRLGAIEADTAGHPLPVGARRAADDGERNPRVEDGVQQSTGTAHRMPKRPDACLLNSVQRGEHRMGRGRIGQNRAHQRPSLHEPIAHRCEVVARV